MKANLRNLSPGAELVFSEVEVLTHDGMSFRSFGAHNADAGMRFRYLVTVHNGYAYQFVASSAQLEVAPLQERLTSFLEGFRLLDKDRVAGANAGAVRPFASAALGIEVDLGKHGGQAWLDLETQFRGAVHGATFGFGSTALLVKSMNLMSPVDLAGVAHAFGTS